MKAKKIIWILSSLLAIFVLINLYTTLSMMSIAQELQTETAELTRPAKIDMITIIDPTCTDCFDILTVVEGIKSANIELTSEDTLEYSNEIAQSLIEKYAIEKIPTVIVTGEIEKEGSEIANLEKKDDALIFTNLNPVYLETSTGDYRGRIEIKNIVNEDCEECYDMNSFITAVSSLISISTEETISLDDASELLTEYNLTEVPAVIFSGDLDLYPEIVTKLEALGTYVGKDLVLTAKLNPPYWDLTEEEIKGLVSVTYLTDDSCKDCYNVNIHKTVLINYGIFIADETTLDISSNGGQKLLKDYSITKVPTIIVSKELADYSTITKVWEQVGTVEEDGSYIFRELDLVSSNYTSL